MPRLCAFGFLGGETTARRPSASFGAWILNIAVKKVSLHVQGSPVLVYALPHCNKQQARRTPCAPQGRPCADTRAGAPIQEGERKRLASSPLTASGTSGLQSTEPSSHRGRCAFHWPLEGRRRETDARAEPGDCSARCLQWTRSSSGVEYNVPRRVRQQQQAFSIEPASGSSGVDLE